MKKDWSMNGPLDRAEVELGFISDKAKALREGLLAVNDPTVPASIEEQRAALVKMMGVIQTLLESPLFTAPAKPKRTRKK